MPYCGAVNSLQPEVGESRGHVVGQGGGAGRLIWPMAEIHLQLRVPEELAVTGSHWRRAGVWRSSVEWRGSIEVGPEP